MIQIEINIFLNTFERIYFLFHQEFNPQEHVQFHCAEQLCLDTLVKFLVREREREREREGGVEVIFRNNLIYALFTFYFLISLY